MDPQHLYAIMHGQYPGTKKPSKKEKIPKTKLDNELDKEIDAYVDGLEFDHNPLTDSKLKRERMKLEIKEAMELSELSVQIAMAIKLLFTEGSRYLSENANKKLISDLSHGIENLEDITIAEAGSTQLQALSKISDDSMEAISKIAIAKCTEERYADCLALYSLLCILNPGDAEYWLRLGVVAQTSGNIDLASRAYAATLALDPNNVGARLFAAECFAQCNLVDKANAELATVKNMGKTIALDKMWLDLIPVVEDLIKEKR